MLIILPYIRRGGETDPEDSSDSHNDMGSILTRAIRPVPEWTMSFFPLRSFLSSGGTAEPVRR